MKRPFSALRGGEAARDCVTVAPWLADRARGLETARVEAHLAACGDCRATVAALERIWRTASVPRADLWGRLAARLESEHTAPLRFPSDPWRAALAAAILITVSWLVPGARQITTLMLFGVG